MMLLKQCIFKMGRCKMIVCVCNDGDNRPGPTQESQDLGEMAPSLS